jgi:hypothetical protein
MRVVVLLLVMMGMGACKKAKPADEPVKEPAKETYNPYKNVMPAKVKADVEKINEQHEEKLDKEIEGAKTQQ